jgi:outer membrane protein TolC
MFRPAILLLAAAALRAEVHSMTLRQAVETALKQNPDITLAHLDEEHTRQAVRIAHAPFTPGLTVGSGLAYSDGFPMSIEGSAPSVFQARATQFLFNRQQSFSVAQAKEDVRGAGFVVGSKRDEVAWRVASLFLDAERTARIGELARKDAESQEKVLAAVEAQVREGRALPLAEKSAAYRLAYSQQTAADLADEQAAAESSLAVALGYPPEDRVRPAEDRRTAPVLPASEDEAVEAALASNQDLRHIQSEIASKQLEIRGERAARWPRVDLVAQYAMLAQFNNYSEFFRKFQRNNGQLGVSFQLPLLSGAGVGAQVAQSETDVAHLRVELATARNRIAGDIHQAFRDVHKAEGAAHLAQLDLDVAREQLSVDLAQMQEGRQTLREVEQARLVENQKWIAFSDAQYALEKARWSVLHLTGGLVGTLEAGR